MNELINPDRHEEAHIIKPGFYALILFILLCLTALTTGVAFIDLGEYNTVIALAIAVGKASLVVLFFMHMKYSSRLLKLTICCGLFCFAIMLALTMTDYISRAWGMF